MCAVAFKGNRECVGDVVVLCLSGGIGGVVRNGSVTEVGRRVFHCYIGPKEIGEVGEGSQTVQSLYTKV